MKTTLSASLMLSASLSGLVGCDSQVDPGYEGEPLFSLHGTVVIEDPEARKELVPAIIYSARDGGEQSVFVEQVSYEGTFPANIELKLFSPPASVTLSHMGAGSGVTAERAEALGEPRFAMGYITAVAPGTAGLLPLDHGFEFNDGCPLSWEEATPDVPCTLHKARCPKDYDSSDQNDSEGLCFHEILECDPAVRDAYQRLISCTLVESYGNPEYSRSIVEQFAGLSQNVAVIFLKTPAAAGSITSFIFNRGAEMPAGYALLRGHPFSTEEMNSSRLCYLDILEEMIGATPPDEPSLTEEERGAHLLDDFREIKERMESRGCNTAIMRRSDFETVNLARDELIEIHISSDGAGGTDPSGVFGGPPV
jgi:hypothetical protein